MASGGGEGRCLKSESGRAVISRVWKGGSVDSCDAVRR